MAIRDIHTRRWFAVVFAATLVAVYFGVGLLGLSDRAVESIRAVVYLVFPICAAAMSLVAVSRAHPAQRRVWALVSSGIICLTLGEFMWAAETIRGVSDGSPGSPLFDVVLIVGYLLILAFILLLLRDRFGALRPLDRIKHGLDGLIVLTLSWCVVAVLVVRPYLNHPGPTSEDISLLFCFIDIAIMSGFIVIIRSGDKTRRMSWQTLAAIGAGLGALAHATLDVLLVRGLYQVSSPQNIALDLLWMSAYLFLTIAAGRFAGGEHDLPPKRVMIATRPHWGDFAPVAAALVFIPAAMWAARDQAWSAWAYWGWTATATTLTVLVAARSSVLAVSNRELASMSATDPLTGVHNHRYFREHLDLEIIRAQRTNSSLAVILLDLDNFRDVNETHGHLVGDQSLRLVAGVLNDSVRALMDIPCRIGGDEFAILLPAADAAEAMRVCERIKTILAIRQEGALNRLTVSAGIAAYPTHALSRDDLLRVADAALYCAKRSGRNRAAVYDVAEDSCCEKARHARLSAQGTLSPEAV